MTKTENVKFINHELDHNHEQIVRIFLYTIQDIFDINPIIIETWLNENYKKYIDKLDSKCFIESYKNYSSLIKKIATLEQPDNFLYNEKEKCGYILDEYNNGYIKYCNTHKYLHNKIGDHVYKQKENNEIIDEKFFITMYNLYVEYTRNVAGKLVDIFIETIQHKTKYVDYDDIDMLNNWLLKNDKCFKEKRIINDKIKVYYDKDDMMFV